MERRAVLFRSTPGAKPNPIKGCYTALAIFLPLIVLRSPEYFPLTVGLSDWYQLASAGGGGGKVLFSIVLAGALVSIVPVIIVFLMLQRFWQGGLALGSLK